MMGNVEHWESQLPAPEAPEFEMNGDEDTLGYVEPGGALLGVIFASIFVGSFVGALFGFHAWWPF